MKEYTLASPTCKPDAADAVAFLPFLNSTTFVVFPPMLMKGEPVTLFTLITLPILNGIDAVFTSLVSLGFSTSTTVLPGKDTSKPLTYALPGDNLTHIKSSSGLFPLSVNWFSVYNPPEPISSLNESWRLTRNGSTA